MCTLNCKEAGANQKTMLLGGIKSVHWRGATVLKAFRAFCIAVTLSNIVRAVL